MSVQLLDRIRTCGRCDAILTIDEIESQRYDDRDRCHGCDDTTGDTGRFLRIDAVHAPTKELSQREWVRRVNIAQDTPAIIVQRVAVWGNMRNDGRPIR